MKSKVLILIMSLLFVFGLVACSRNTADDTVVEEEYTDVNGDDYYDIYTKNYDASLMPLQEQYGMYGDIGLVEEYYQTNEYPGNKQYLNKVREALVDSRDKVEEFVNNMERDAKSDVEDINRLNKDMIDEGRDLIEDIDERIKKLDSIADKELNKTEAEFRKLVSDTIRLEEDGKHDFENMLKNIENEVEKQKKGNTNTNSK